ncbi:MAG: protein kinase, partial [Gammaproteobacteria bacterium]|nr:protein kinase [Gammaproteobacteria bacterium]
MSGYPKKIAKYEILGVLGRGAMGVVYLAHDPFVDRKVAIKLCTLGDASDDSARARKMFFNEAQSAGALDHPNILRIYDAGETAHEPYIVMEYVEGADT